MVLWDSYNRRGGRESTEILGMLNLPWQGSEKEKEITKFEAYTDMAERLVRDLDIEEDLLNEIKTH